MIAKLIWEMGLPNISEAEFAVFQITESRRFLSATEQQRVLLATEQQQNSIGLATNTILDWLSMLANSIQKKKATPAYTERTEKP